MFGLDIGHGTVRLMQLTSGKKCKVIGYGEISFDVTAVAEGIVVKHEVVAEAVQKLFRHSLIGDITTKRVALSPDFTRFYPIN